MWLCQHQYLQSIHYNQYYYKLKSKNVIKIRNQSNELEDEFASALFQLGNRLGDGLPAEIRRHPRQSLVPPGSDTQYCLLQGWQTVGNQ